ncbi:hypothetical protein [Brevibacillus sp. NRS-1366]|uniref:hypothetical protein n=1 Tax=Brevibacillus sp. NRS-1366 TaxID=3233899 RepID=UPI003D1F95ED
MKKRKNILAVTVLSAVALFYGYSNLEAKDPHAAQEIQQKWEVYAQNEIKKKLLETYADAIQEFNLDESQYTYNSLRDEEFKGLGKNDSVLLYNEVFKNVIKEQKQGDFEPGLFLKNDLSEAVVLYKELESGTNHMYVFKLNDKDQWALVDDDSKKGKKVEKVQYKSLKQFTADTLTP